MKKKILSALLTLSLVFGMISGFITPLQVIAAEDVDSHTVSESDIPLRLYYDEEASHGVAEGYDDWDAYDKNTGAPISKHVNDDWERWSIPLGSGYFGANVFGRTGTERIQLTDKTLANPYRITSGSEYTDGLNNFSETYIDFNHDSVTDYSRELDLKTAVSSVSYKYNNVTYTREYFTSYPDRAMVIKLDASTTGALTFTLRPTIPYEQEYMNTAGDGGGKWGTVTSSVTDGVGEIVLSGTLEYFDIDFVGLYKVVTNGGTVSAANGTNADGNPDDGTITVSGATSAYIIITLGTDYELCEDTFTQSRYNKPTFSTDLDDAKAKVDGYMTAIESVISGKSYVDAYAELKNRHLADYQEIFGRVSLDLNCKESDYALTTDVLLENYKNGSGSTYLEALYFQYGRYLLIASSRSGALPANLQGTWNRYNHSPWSSGYWHNINVQMNYWPAFSTNIAETFEAYVQYNNAYMAKAQKGATSVVNSYNSAVLGTDGGNGWCIQTGGYVNDVNSSTSLGNLGFTTQLFWEYYEHTQDENILREVVYPVLVGAARFITKMVREDENGYYIAFEADSPEQYTKNQTNTNTWYHTDKGTTYAQTFAYQNNYNLLLAAKELGISTSDTTHEDYAILQTVLEQLDKYDPIRIGLSGYIKEFFEEEGYYDDFVREPQHRHISQLVGLYPGNVINGNTPAWMDAAEYVLTERGDEATGWGVAHRLNLWARVQNGERAYDLLEQLLSANTATNLWDLHPPFQIDGNLGGTAGIAEMLLQSHAGYVEPLAAIPAAWVSGSYTGLVARGNFEVSAAWASNTLSDLNIKSLSGGSVSVKYSGIENATVCDSTGKVISYTVSGDDLITFNTTEGETYYIWNFTKETKPSEVQNLTIETEFLSTSTLSWTASSDVVSYNVYVAKESEPTYTLLTNTTSTSYVYTPGAFENYRLTFAVTAVNSAGVESDRALVYRDPDDTSAPVESVSANVVDGELQVAIKSNEYASKYYLYSRASSTAEWGLVQESSYPIIIDATYDSTLKYSVAVKSFYGDMSDLTLLTAFNQAFDSIDYNAANIFEGLKFKPSTEALNYLHNSAHGNYDHLTNGIGTGSDSRFSTKGSSSDVLEATINLPTTFLLGELQLFDFNGSASNASHAGSYLKVDIYVDGEWQTVAEYNSNDEILALHKSGTDGNYKGVDLSTYKTQRIRIRITTPASGGSISLNEVRCTGIALNTGTPYCDNILLGKEVQLTDESLTWMVTTSNGGEQSMVEGLTDGTLRYSENAKHWRTWYGKENMVFDGTVDLGGEALLDELRLYYYSGNYEDTYSSVAPNIQILTYYDGTWTTVHNLTIDSTTVTSYKCSETVEGTSNVERWLSIDMNGVKAEKLRIYLPPKSTSGQNYGMYEITLSGYYESNGSSYSSNVFEGNQFVPTEAAAAKIWSPHTYDKLTDGATGDSNRMATSGTASFVDGTLTFDGYVANLETLTINYGQYTQVRSGTGLVIQVLGKDGAWTDALNLVYDTIYQNEHTYDLGGVEALAVRLSVPGVYPSAVGNYTTGDCIVIQEISCSGVLTPYESNIEYVENILLGKTPTDTDTTGIHTADYDFPKLTDGSLDSTSGRFALAANSNNYATVTYSFGGTVSLQSLVITDFYDGNTSPRSNQTTIEFLVNGEWVTYLDAQPLWDSTNSGVISGQTRAVTFDVCGYTASGMRITFKNTNTTSGVTICEISLSGNKVTNGGEYKDNLFTGHQFVAGEGAGAVWSPNTYDKITDGGTDNNTRFVTSNGAPADGVIDFEGKVVELHTLTVIYDPSNEGRCGKDFTLYVYRNGEWQQILYYVHTSAANSKVYELGGVEAEKLRFTISGKYEGTDLTGESNSKADTIAVYEMSCTGYILPEEEATGPVEDTSSNILLGTTNDQITLILPDTITPHQSFTDKEYQMFDGDYGTRYAVNDKSPYYYSVEIELNSTYSLYTFTVYPFYNQGEASRSNNTSIEVYIDGAWITVAKEVEIAASTSTAIDLGGVMASKIRINFANTEGTQCATIYEMTCTAGTVTAVDRKPLLDAYIALEQESFGNEDAVANMTELKAMLGDTAADQAAIDSYVSSIKTTTDEISLKTDAYGDFSSYNLELNGDVGFNFYANLADGTTTTFPNAYVLVEYVDYYEKAATVKRIEVPLSTLGTDSTGRYIYTINIPAAQMTDTIKLRLVFDESNMGATIEESIRNYADKVLADETLASSHNLIKAMLNYGGHAQTYFGYNTENLANNGISVDGISGSTDSGVFTATGGDTLASLSPSHWSLALESNVNIRLYFVSSNISNYTFSYKDADGNNLGSITPEEVYTNMYRVEIEMADVKYIDNVYTLTITEQSSGNVAEIQLSAMKYVEKMINGNINTDEKLIKLGEAMKLYCAVANAYVPGN